MGLGKWLEDNSVVIMSVLIVLFIIIIFIGPLSYLGVALKRTAMGVLDPSTLQNKRLGCGCVQLCKCGRGGLPDESDYNGLGMQAEHLGARPARRRGARGGRVVRNPKTGRIERLEGDDPETSILDQLGYGEGASWEDTLAATEVDPSVHENHSSFVADTRRFSSGANFTATNDEDGNAAFTNFVGLQRPQHVEVLPDARQQPDVDQTVLQRNKQLRWSYKAEDYPL